MMRKDEGDIFPLGLEADEDPLPVSLESFNLYTELTRRIKQSLNCVRKESPVVRIDMPFDFILYEGGLKARGYFTREHYKFAGA